MKLRELKPHQAKALAFAVGKKRRAGLFMDPGTGKTIVGIRLAVSPTLVLCRRDDFLTWLTELSKEHIPSEHISVIESAADIDTLKPTKWVICTYDLVKKKKVRAFLDAQRFKTVIGDELHAIKHWKTKRTQAVIHLTRSVPYRIGMTGTPITNNLEDVFAECFFIDSGATFGDNLWKFKTKYYIKSGPGWYPKRGAKERITQRLENVGFSVSADEVLKLPPARTVLKSVPMTSRQRKAYERVVEDWEFETKQGIYEIDHVISRLAKLRQIASGFVYDADKRAIWLSQHSNKIDLLFEMLGSKDHLAHKPKVVVWAMYRAELDRIEKTARELGISCVRYRGNSKELVQARLDFQNKSSVRLFVAQADRGVGMNELVVADTAIYFSNSLRVVSRQQSERRVRRIGSEHHSLITYYDLVTEGTYDLELVTGLQNKISVASSILERLRQGASIHTILSQPVSKAKIPA